MARSQKAGILGNPVFWLGVVALVFAGLQVAFVDLTRFLAWDEAIYASEVSRFGDAIFLDAHRARGVTFLVAPIVQMTNSIDVMRVYLVSLSSVGLLLSFWPVARVAGWTGPLGAAIFGTSWLTIFYGSELMPNLYAALLAVAVVGLSFVFSRTRSAASLSGVVFCSAGLALVRPLDAVTIAMVVIGMLAIVAQGARFRLLIGLTIGTALGAGAWLLEAYIRFGSPILRLERTRELVGGGVQNNVVEYLRLLDGPLSGPDRLFEVDFLIVTAVLILALLTGVGLIVSDSEQRRYAGVFMAAAVVMVLPYIAFSEATAPRFLLPFVAFLSLSTAVAVLELGKERSSGARVSYAVLLTGVLLGMNFGVLDAVDSSQSDARDRGLILAMALEGRAGGDECYFLSSTGYPQLSYLSGCRGGRFVGDLNVDLRKLEAALESGSEAFIVINNPEQLDLYDELGMCEAVSGLESRNWQICTLPISDA